MSFEYLHNLNVLHLILLGLILGLLHLPLVLEISLSNSLFFGISKNFLILLYPLSVAMMGIGAVFFNRTSFRDSLIIISLSLFGFMGSNILIPNNIVDILFIPAHIFFQSIFLIINYVFIGGIYANLISKTKEENTFLAAWIFHSVALGVGYWASDFIVESVGPSAFILSAAISFLLLPWFKKFSFALFLIIMLLSYFFRLDYFIESNRRNFEKYAKSDEDSELIKNEGNKRNSGQLEFIQWTRRGQMRVYDTPTGEFDFYYDLIRSLSVHDISTTAQDNPDKYKKSNLMRYIAYNYFPKGSRLAIIGFGGGKSLAYIESDNLSENIFGIEINKSAVLFSRDLHPELSNNKIKKITSIISDGRHFIEKSQEKFDLIYLESALNQIKITSLGIYSTSSLHTQEAIDLYINKLKENGLLIFEVRTGRQKGTKEKLIEQTYENIKKYSPFLIFEGQKAATFVLAKNEETLNKFKDALPMPFYLNTFRDSINSDQACSQKLTDSRPFIVWNCADEEFKDYIIKSSYIIFFITTLIVFLINHFKSVSREKTAYFYMIGVAHSLFTFHTFYVWRSYYGDDLITFLRLVSYFIFCTIVSVVLISKYSLANWKSYILFIFLFLLLALHFIFLAYIPFEHGSEIFRELYAILAVLPGGVLIGLMYPLAFSLIKKEEISPLILADAMGTFASFSLLNIVFLQFGLMSLGIVSACIYVLIVCLFIKTFKSIDS
ncbi:MAG: hypothetical protein WC635_16390 [Bacteriovorax sp.]